ncbi:hypothetical protein PENTCL1PPCAC_3115, partial [Pristionchus entomophagus]
SPLDATMIATSLLFLFLAASLVDSSCLHCSSPLITLKARQLDVNFDRTHEGDPACIRNLTKVHMPSACKGACLTVNLTRDGESEPSGVLRDCLDSHRRVKRKLEEKRESDSFAGACYSESVQMRGATYTATYCACVGHHCNADGTPLAGRTEEEAWRGDRRRGSRLRSSPNGTAGGVQSLPLVFVAMLAARRL